MNLLLTNTSSVFSGVTASPPFDLLVTGISSIPLYFPVLLCDITRDALYNITIQLVEKYWFLIFFPPIPGVIVYEFFLSFFLSFKCHRDGSPRECTLWYHFSKSCEMCSFWQVPRVLSQSSSFRSLLVRQKLENLPIHHKIIRLIIFGYGQISFHFWTATKNRPPQFSPLTDLFDQRTPTEIWFFSHGLHPFPIGQVLLFSHHHLLSLTIIFKFSSLPERSSTLGIQ